MPFSVDVQRIKRVMGRSLVVCIGNDLVGDDAVGYEMYHLLVQADLSPQVRVCLLGVGGMALIDELDGEEQLIVVDAVQFGSAPGSVHVLDWEQIPASEMRPVSGHGIGVREVLQVCRKLYPDKAPESIHLVGVEGICFDKVGSGLSIEVKKAVEPAVAQVIKLVS